MVESDDKRVIARSENLLLSQSPLDFVSLNHLLFAQYWALLAMILT